jgi:lysyl-tRNA synthetase class 2
MEINWALARKMEKLAKRARIVQAIRAFFVANDFLEVETPHRIPGNAPELHIDAVPSAGWFLHTSPELCMKRLLAAGFPKIFQICRCWREGERGSRHLPEYTMLEWYRAGADYRQLMIDCEELLAALAPERNLLWQNRRIDLTPPWPRLSVAEAFARFAGVTAEVALAADRFDEIVALEIEPRLGWEKPVILFDYPAPLAALARRKAENPAVAERFELYIGGLELANAFSELTDPREQRERFAAEEAARRAAGKAPYPVPEPFLQELGHMPEAAGIALGVDRLAMLLTGSTTIDEVTAFTSEDL